MPNINFTSSSDGDLGNRFISKDYLMSVYPQIAGQLITPELCTWGRNIFAIGDNTGTDRSTPSQHLLVAQTGNKLLLDTLLQ